MRFRVALLLLLCSTSALAEVAVTKQVLDSVYSFTPGAVLEMNFADYNPNDPLHDDPAHDLLLKGPGGSNLNLQSCKATAVGGVFCLDGQIVRQWPNPLKPTISNALLNCTTDLGVRLGKADGCVAMTVDVAGHIWLSVKKGNSHSVYKVVRNGTDACSIAQACSISEPYTGRPPIVDLVPVDGDLAKVWGQSGVLGIEERKSAVFFPDAAGVAAVPVITATQWNLKNKELLQDISPLLLTGTSGSKISVLATTTLGRVLTRGLTEVGSAREVKITKILTISPLTYTTVALGTCTSSAEAAYGIRVSSTTGIIYISDSKCKKVFATEASGSDPSFTQLNYINELTAQEGSTTYSVIGLTLAPGVSINLTDCSNTAGCSLVSGLIGPNGKAAASLQGVQLASSDSGATVFQVKGIPDCRMGSWLAPAEQDICTSSDSALHPVIVPEVGSITFTQLLSQTVPPQLPQTARYRLNVTPMLPDEVRLAFEASGLRSDGKLPDLLISRQYRAQKREGKYVFEAFFVIPQPSVQFKNTFNTEYQVNILEGDAVHVNDCAKPATLIQWDITTHVSEVNLSVPIKVGVVGEYIDTLSNIGCGSVRGAVGGLSLLPYDLQVNPDTWVPPADPVQEKYTTLNDAVFARLLQKLYADLYVVQTLYACPGGTDSTPPLTSSQCATLTQRYNLGLSKLTDCINAAFQPKSSASNQLCQAFSSQLGTYQAALPATTPQGDVDNRVGELQARIQTLFHLYKDRFLPSIPAWGFCMESNGCTAAGTAPPPWPWAP